jgi:hypothetical protein
MMFRWTTWQDEGEASGIEYNVQSQSRLHSCRRDEEQMHLELGCNEGSHDIVRGDRPSRGRALITILQLMQVI